MQQPLTTIETAGAAASEREPQVDRLGRLFRAIVFDWDGTAVRDRREDASALAALSEALLRYGMWLAVVTGTNFGNIDRQFVHLLAPVARPRLLVCTNRGSEVYGFDRRGVTVRRYLRVATPEEDKQLNAIAETVRDRLTAETGLEVRIVYNRLNRRKIDLIPLPEWADPPKAQIGALLRAVEQRLERAGLRGGLADAIALTRQIAREQGLPDARITSDVKHIEVGLTDKRDSVHWLRDEFLRQQGISLADVLIAGDEFGPIAGFNGSDDLLRDRMEDALAVSVGAEPNGVPAGVLALGGGPARFRALLAEQLKLCEEAGPPGGETSRGRAAPRSRAAWIEHALASVAGPEWRLEATDPPPALEHAIESRFAIVNGFLGVRASLEDPGAASQPRTFVAGLYDTDDTQPPMPVLVSAPDWLRLRVSIGDQPLGRDTGEPGGEIRTLDLRRGLLIHERRLRSSGGEEVRLRTLRFVSLVDRALGVQAAEIAVAKPTELTVEAWIEPPQKGLVPAGSADAALIWRTADGDRQLALAAAADLAIGGRLEPSSATEQGRWRWTWAATPDQKAVFLRTAAFAARGLESDAAGIALAALHQARSMEYGRLLDEHAGAWATRWAAGDVIVEGDEAAQQALRFAVYHLVSAPDPDKDHTSIGARSLTGDSYSGHVFWDTEIFLLPFYIYTWPEAARALLMYRFHTLPAARAKAARLGYRGACYAWESADTGEEVTPPYAVLPTGEVIPIRNGTEELHISADVAYAVWQYWQATGDSAFLLDAGAEILLETARFWGSRASLEPDRRYHIRHVIGPDEYHEGVDDDAFTNGMAQWNLERGVEAARLLAAQWPDRWQELQARLSLGADEIGRWQDVADRLVTGAKAGSDLIEQFAGFFDLEQVDLTAYSSRTAPMDVVLGRERTRRAQVLKQADVVMLLALLWDRFPQPVREANFRYYQPRTGHGSSLDPAIHALVAARLGDVELAHRYFHQAGAIDLDDAAGSAAQGVHIGAMGGLWQAAVFGFAGVTLQPDGLRIDPHLPGAWSALKISLRWRGRVVHLELGREPQTVQVTAGHGPALAVHVGGLHRALRRGQTWSCRFDATEQRWLEAPA